MISCYIYEHHRKIRIRHTNAGQWIDISMKNEYNRASVKSINGEFKADKNFPETAQYFDDQNTYCWRKMGYLYVLVILTGFTYQLTYSLNGTEKRDDLNNMIDRFINECYQSYGETFGVWYSRTPEIETSDEEHHQVP